MTPNEVFFLCVIWSISDNTGKRRGLRQFFANCRIFQHTQPVTLRAHALKNEMKETEHVKYKLENKEQDIKDLKLTLKQKNEELSEMTVRRDLAEKKLATATRDADITIEKLQRKLDDTYMMLRRKEKVTCLTMLVMR